MHALMQTLPSNLLVPLQTVHRVDDVHESHWSRQAVHLYISWKYYTVFIHEDAHKFVSK